MADSFSPEGYRECHVCQIDSKMAAPRCRHCSGRLDLTDLLLLEKEKRRRYNRAPLLSAVIPGMGQWYSGRPYLGAFVFFLFSLCTGLILVNSRSWGWGLLIPALSLALIWFLSVVDSRNGLHRSGPPCQEACPANLPCSRYLHLTAAGKDLESLELIELTCPFPGTIGRICHHPCERECSRGKDGGPVAICALERFVDDRTDRSYNFYRRELDREVDPVDRKIAVVGAGPSGLTSALYLKLIGFEVVIFEARQFGGGTPAVCSPEYRLPKGVYEEEVNRILDLDMELKFGMELGKDFELKDLQRQGYHGVYLALGATRPVVLPHTGDPDEGFLDGRDFLERVVAGEGVKLPGEVLVIGGGNLAVDVARCAVRCGASKVSIVCLEKVPDPEGKTFGLVVKEWRRTEIRGPGDYMQARHRVIQDARDEGVHILERGAAVSFDRRNGRVVKANCLKVERIARDSEGRLIPELDPETEFSVKADWVITAVGSVPDFSFMGGVPRTSVPVKGVPMVQVEGTSDYSIPILAGGDLAMGPATMVEAIAAGREAAFEFYRLLAGTPEVSVRFRVRSLLEPRADYSDTPEYRRRHKERTIDKFRRVRSFEEVNGGFDEKEGREEADRCMRCDWPLVGERKVAKLLRKMKRTGTGKFLSRN